jgi:hypothetical protein
MSRERNDYSDKEPMCDENMMMMKIVDFSSYLQWLNIDGRYLSDVSMIAIIEGCPNIQFRTVLTLLT